MFELAVLMVLFLAGAVIVTTLAVVVGLLKLVFKLLLIPLAIAGWFIKAIFGILAAAALLIVLGPIVLGLGLVVLLPMLLLASLVWGAVSVLSPA